MKIQMEKRNKYFIYKRDAHLHTHTHIDTLAERVVYTEEKAEELFCTLREMGELVRTVKNTKTNNRNLAKNNSPPRPSTPQTYTPTHTH